MRFVICCVCLFFPVAGAACADSPLRLSASLGASTSTVINDVVFNRPQFSANVDGRYKAAEFGATVASAYSGGNNGTDHQDRYFVAYEQPLAPFRIKYQATLRTYPGTRAGLTDTSLNYAVTASHSFGGINCALGLDYNDKDYTTTRKSYGINASLSHGFAANLSGWLSISHHHQFGSVDYTNTNLGLYYQLTSKFGVSTSINNWHAYAVWAHDQPTLSISLSRKL